MPARTRRLLGPILRSHPADPGATTGTSPDPRPGSGLPSVGFSPRLTCEKATSSPPAPQLCPQPSLRKHAPYTPLCTQPVENFWGPIRRARYAVRMPTSPVLVAAGAIVDDLRRPTRLLAARRSAPKSLAGRWEFA